jgi:hypothetical protein
VGRRISEDGPMSEFLVAYLDAIDERLLDYLGEHQEFRLDRVKTNALLRGCPLRRFDHPRRRGRGLG